MIFSTLRRTSSIKLLLDSNFSWKLKNQRCEWFDHASRRWHLKWYIFYCKVCLKAWSFKHVAFTGSIFGCSYPWCWGLCNSQLCFPLYLKVTTCYECAPCYSATCTARMYRPFMGWNMRPEKRLNVPTCTNTISQATIRRSSRLTIIRG